MAIWVTSDWHFNHNKEFIYKARRFDSIEEMNETIITRHNEIVKPEDIVYVLGDCGLGGGSAEALAANKTLIERLNGNLYIIRGNHDSDTRIDMYNECKNVIKAGDYAYGFKYNGYHFYLSHYPAICSNFDDGKSLKSRTINLCGHSHTTDPFVDWDKYNSAIFHCEMDTHNCVPWELDEIIKLMKEKIND